MIFHVGMNTVAQRASFEQITSDYVNLIKACRRINPNIKIVTSAIIPGPVDHNVTDPIIQKINSYLQESLSNEFKFKFTFSYKPLLMLEKSEENFMLFGDGGLHLNMEGINKLRFFLRVISTLSV